MSRPRFFTAPRKGQCCAEVTTRPIASAYTLPRPQARTLSCALTVSAVSRRARPAPLTAPAAVNSEYRDRRKDAIKRVIANMTVGKDVSGLFPDVLKNMQTDDLEQKKLVYLYLMNYAKTQPELVILAVNTFVKVRRSSYALQALCG